MELNTTIAAEIVVIVTAAIGVWKWFLRKPENMVMTDDAETSLRETIAAMALPFLPMLMFPAFMVAFMFLIQLIDDVGSTNSPKSPAIQIDQNSSEAELMLALALEISNRLERDEALEKIIKYAEAQSEYHVLIEALRGVSNNYKQSELAKILVNDLIPPGDDLTAGKDAD